MKFLTFFGTCDYAILYNQGTEFYGKTNVRICDAKDEMTLANGR